MKKNNMVSLARTMRRQPTQAEKELWKILRNRGVGGYKFVRQFPIPSYIVDFCCRERKLVIELDGGGHMDKQDTDRKREEYLGSLGYRVIRFNNNQFMQEMNQVYEAILSALSDERL